FTPAGNPGIKVDLHPFGFTAADLKTDSAFVDRLPLPLFDLDGLVLIDAPSGSDFNQYLDFNVVGPGEAVGMIQQLGTWLQQFKSTDMLGGFNIPFAKAVLGNLLAFEDLIHDTLLTDDKDNGDSGDDLGKLLAKVTAIDPNAFIAAFGTAQELGA